MNTQSILPVESGSSHEFERRIDLGGAWQFAWSFTVPSPNVKTCSEATQAGLNFLEAIVPGNFELDLQRQGLIEEPFYGMNITHLREFEDAHVWYARKFNLETILEGPVELVFEGLDCFASIYLNGSLIGEADNMLVEHVFDVQNHLRSENELFIHLRPARLEARNYDYPPNLGTFRANYESLYIRKAPHMYGWDIMPRALSAGIWRPAFLRMRPAERIETLYLETLHLDDSHSRAELSLKYNLKTVGGVHDQYQLLLEGHCGESVFKESISLFFDAGGHRFTLENPKLWQPAGHGEAHLYEVSASLFKNGLPIDHHAFRFGVRTLELVRTSITNRDGEGEFCFRINGEKVFAKGTNWVPLDAFHSRDSERLERAIDLAVQSNCNMVRCWGGNVYEPDRFFDLCDAHGLMVWQDFAMGCAVYPQDDQFASQLAREVRSVIKRLRQHPSLVLWAGDNECDMAYAWHSQGDPNRNHLTRKVLPAILREEDSQRPYLPSSPYIDEIAHQTGEEFLTEYHLWGPRGYYKADFYMKSLCHFASEIGYHGCPTPNSIRKFISPERVWPRTNNPEWNLHSTSPAPGYAVFGPEDSRVELMANQIRELFGAVPESLEDFAFASQATQAEAKKTFIELFRGAKWRRTGILWWNLLDGWPQFSDAVVDYYFEKKLAYHYITRSQQHLCLMCREPEQGRLELVAVNDTLQAIPFTYRVLDVERGAVLLEGAEEAPANQAVMVGCLPHDPEGQAFLLFEWSSALGMGCNHYLHGKPPFSLEQYKDWLRKAGMRPDEAVG